MSADAQAAPQLQQQPAPATQLAQQPAVQQQQPQEAATQDQQQQQPGSDAAAAAPAGATAAGEQPAAPAAPPQEDPVEVRRREDALLEQARIITVEWQRRALAYGPRHEDPPRPHTHWDFLLKEAHWLARDVGQERLWKRRAAFHIGHAAAAEGRRRLQAAAGAKEAAAKAATRGKKKDEGAAAALLLQQQSIADILADELQPSMELAVDYLHYWANNGEFTQCVIAHLENADVQRLLRIYQYSQKYEADWEVAWLQAEQKAAELMKSQPGGDDDAMAKRGKRKAAKVRVDVDDDGGDDMGTPTPAAMPNSKAAQQVYARDKRKRKVRDVDDDDYVAGHKGGGRLDGRRMPGMAGGSGMVRSGSDMSLAAGDPRMNKRLKNTLSSKQADATRLDAAARGHGMLGPQRTGLARSQSASLPHGWGYDDDVLLAALVVEYNYNWHFIADTCSSTCVLQGVTRRSEWCKQRHAYIMKAGEQAAAEAAAGGGAGGVGPDGQLLEGGAGGAGPISNLAHLSKHQAKELIMRSLPVPESVLKRHADAINPIFAKKKQQMLQDREAVRKQNEAQAEPHVSHFKLAQAALNQSGGRVLNPLEITEQEEAARKQAAALARQAELEQQQQQAAAAAAAAAQQQQQAAAAAAAAAQQQQQQAAAAAQQQQQAVSGGAASLGASPSMGGGSQGGQMQPGTAQQVQAQQVQTQQQQQQQQQQQAAAMAAMQQRPGTPGQVNAAGNAATLQALAQRSGSLTGGTAAALTPTSSAQLGNSQATAAAAAAQQRAGSAGRPTTPGVGGVAPRPAGAQLTPEQQMLLMQQQQQQAAAAAQQQARQRTPTLSGQAAPTQQQQQQQQVTSPNTQQQQMLAQQRQVQQYAQQQAAQQQLMAQRMAAGYQLPGAAAGGTPGIAAVPGMLNPQLAAQMAAQAGQKGTQQLQQQLATGSAGAVGKGSTPRPAGTPGAMMAGGMPHAALAVSQQQLAGLNNQQALAQMQLLQPMGSAGGMPGAAGAHPGMPGAQGMMWPLGAANMQQSNLAQLMQLQQQQQGKQVQVTAAQQQQLVAVQQAAAAAGGQPAPSQPPS